MNLEDEITLQSILGKDPGTATKEEVRQTRIRISTMLIDLDKVLNLIADNTKVFSLEGKQFAYKEEVDKERERYKSLIDPTTITKDVAGLTILDQEVYSISANATSQASFIISKEMWQLGIVQPIIDGLKAYYLRYESIETDLNALNPNE